MKYNNKHIFFFLFICCTAFVACDKYLDITPKGKTVLITVNHYDQWLNDNSTWSVPTWLDYLGDNVDKNNIETPPAVPSSLVYIWAEQHNAPDFFWTEHYAHINKYNTVLVGIDQATEGTEEKKAALKAEALLGRAFEYFYLVNEYGPAYDPATAEQNLAVPFVSSNNIGEPIPSRATVKDIYDHIIADLEDALPYLPADNATNRFRGSVGAAYSVLARTYFYMRNYSAAAQNAQLALDNSTASMINYTGARPSSNLLSLRPDAIYAREGADVVSAANLDFMRTFDRNDFRMMFFYRSSDGYTFTQRGATYYSASFRTDKFPNSCGTSVQEMKLIIAEAAARDGDLPTALQQLNDIRINRFPGPAYQALESTDQETVFQWALRERAFELAYNGLRWFDMRRLDKEGMMETVHRYDADGNIIATLEPNSSKYTLQIPFEVMEYHSDWLQNPWEE